MRSNAIAMYRSTTHWRPLVNGYSSYWPAGFVERIALSRRVPNPEALQKLVCQTGVRSILVNLIGYPPQSRLMWRRAQTIPLPGLKLVWASSSQLLFDVTLPPPGAPRAPPCPT